MAELRTGRFGEYYGSEWGTSEPLNYSQMQTNARYIYSALKYAGWTTNAVCAVLGNMEAESSINSGRWQSDAVGNTSGGYGLVQWTPSTKYTDWAYNNGYSDPSEMDSNIARMLYEVDANVWIPTSQYNYSYKTFTTDETKTVSELAKAFLLNFERPADQSTAVQEKRAGMAKAWYEFLVGETPVEPSEPSEPSNPSNKRKKKKFKFLLFNARRRKQWTAKNF